MAKKLKTSSGTISKKKYEKELYKLQAELCQLQEWVVRSGARVIVVFEGRDAAGKGGVIKLSASYTAVNSGSTKVTCPEKPSSDLKRDMMTHKN
ncbi:MAG: hypothetical protein GQ559_04515 [Desulfobulbaceae bacterium]|nr:hypothetical protein [Desulfobulbaceae bacterium]